MMDSLVFTVYTHNAVTVVEGNLYGQLFASICQLVIVFACVCGCVCSGITDVINACKNALSAN